MSEKVTFGELIESIAEDTDNSKQFTHDFLKDFVDVIHGGLEEDGKVNIAGFGKFELKPVDEREGFNPQTQEKITIPAHNKVVFKPYKDVRELVNAPYAHMEPQLIEEDSTSDEGRSAPNQQAEESQTGKTGTESDTSTDEQAEEFDQEQKSELDTAESPEKQEGNKDDFIPTAPPTSHEPDSDEEESTPERSDEVQEDDNGDIVEFNGSQSDAETEDDLLEEFISSGQQEQQEESSEDLVDEGEPEPKKNETHEDEAESPEKEPIKSEEDASAEEQKKLEQAAEDLKQYQPDKPDQQDTQESTPTTTLRPSERNSSFLYVAAAAIILLLLAGGAWYYSTLSTEDTTLNSSSEETTASADMSNQQGNNQQQPAAPQEADDSQQAAQNQSQSAAQSSSTAQPTENTTPNKQAVEIEEGQTLWSLAEQRYGNPRLWPWIYGNNGSLDDPDLIYAGSQLSVPLPSGPQNNLSSTDSVDVAKGFIATYKWYKSNEPPKAKNHLWAAKLYHDDLQQLADVPIDKTDLSYANRAR